MKATKLTTLGILLVLATTSSLASDSFAISEEVREKIEPVLTRSGGEVSFFQGPAGMIGVGLTYTNGRQMVFYASPDGSTVFSGVAVDVASGKNISNADLQKLPPPDFNQLVEMVANSEANTGRPVSMVIEGNKESSNQYFVFVDPRCGYCHKTYNAFLKMLADGQDLLVHYIPVGILGPESENYAKEVVGSDSERALELMRALARGEKPLTTGDTVAAGNAGHGANLALFRELQFDAVPVVISDVGGIAKVRRGMVSAEALEQELRIAKVEKVASAK